MTSDPNPSLPRVHVPKTGKHFPRKHVWPKSALLHKDFRGLGPKHSVGCPKNGKTHFPKTRLAEIGTVAQRFPGFGSKTFCRMSQKWGNSFPENTFRPFEDCCTNISGVWVQNISSDVPKTGKHFPRKHVWPKMGHQSGIIASKWGQMCIFSARRFGIIADANIFKSIYHATNCVLKKFRKLPSARRIFPKVFRRSHFWTSNSCPFSQKFFESWTKSNKI